MAQGSIGRPQQYRISWGLFPKRHPVNKYGVTQSAPALRLRTTLQGGSHGLSCRFAQSVLFQLLNELFDFGV